MASSKTQDKKPRLLYLILCDTLTTDSYGKKTLVGTFDRLSSAQLPCVIRLFNIVTGWEGLEGDYTMTAKNEGQNAIVFSSPPIGLRFEKPLHRADAILQVANLKFDEPGLYTVTISLSDGRSWSHPLLVEHAAGGNMSQEKVT